MTDAEAAALDLLAEQRQTMVALHTITIERNSEISSLKEQLATFQTADAQAAVAQEREWFDAFRDAVFPPAASVEQQPMETVG